MKIHIDLLPEERKEEIRKKKIFKKVIGQEIRFLFPLIVFIFFLAVTNVNLKNQLEELSKTTSQSSAGQDFRKIDEFEKKFREINSKVLSEAGFQQSHLIWSNVFGELSKAIPDGLYLTNLATENYLVTVSGKAKTRDNLLAFQEELRKSSCFSGVDVPLSNLVSKENVEFKINLEINKDCLKNNAASTP